MNVKYENETINSALFDVSHNTLTDIIDNETYEFFSINDYNSIDALPSPYNKPELVIFEGVYQREYISVYKFLRKKRIPYIIVPRGSLTQKGQEKKKIKKIIGNVYFFNKFVRNANSIHFLTQNEYLESKKFKFRDFFIVGNGIELPKKTRDFKKDKNESLIVSFIGRIEKYHKGLDLLFEAILACKDMLRKKNVVFNFYGPDKEHSEEYLVDYAKNNDFFDLVFFKGPISGKEKEDVLLKTDLFVHTSRLEGHPTSVIEAISYGVPVLVTPGTNVSQEVREYNLGFVAKEEPKDIATTLEKLIMEKGSFEKISQNEIRYSKENYEWRVIVEKAIEVYKQIINE